MEPQPHNSTMGKVGLAMGAVAVVLAIPLFGIKVPKLQPMHEGGLMALFIASMATCSLVGSRRPMLGVVVLPICFFGVSCLACWWLAS